MSGTLYGLGLGPGDPELLTLKAARLLSSVPVVAYPAPDRGESFARAIVAPRLTGKREIAVVIPMRVDPAPAQGIYEEAAERIAAVLDSGENVAFLCEGDPLFYGTFMYVLERLRDRFPVEIVPGISSVMAGAAAARMPLALRGETLTVISATLSDEEIAALLEHATAFAFMKVGRHLPRVRALLNHLGLASGCVYLERVTLAEEKVAPLAEAQEPAPYFSLILGRRELKR
ncbi:precorrin-2 C(20)-methyltransferase [Consotaella salsifontis]|uniref:Precorrin-2/cobalt-factor-2 C20-methyltransferase n=1 Tax=Consotaella salsifontis TaxID=1365950 RepID=A0A1T4SJ43_9HYPH|nr:precorrin-2 C(20)-methyltransferase [Consotaella salsifontis]SKA28212.1 precorrin-2/cobalt-factor-2 C20-methyltransferase [Consotaella salsifontis]